MADVLANGKVLLLGGTGRTGRRVLEQLLERGVGVRAVVRSPAALPAGLAGKPGLEVVEASLLSLSDEDLRRHVQGCTAVISCLGHTLSVRGVLGPPRDLVTRAVRRVVGSIESLRPMTPVKLVLMTSVSVEQPGTLDARRGAFERAFTRLIRALVPPAADNQAAADYLRDTVGPRHPLVEWVVVRPDSLLEGGVSAYEAHPGLVNALLSPGRSTMANVAHFMCALVTDPGAWQEWKGRLPVVVDVPVR